MRSLLHTPLLAIVVTSMAAQTPITRPTTKRPTAAEALAHANALLASTPLVDGHNDLPWAIREDKRAPLDVDAYDLRKHTPHQTDIARMKAGHVGGQFWSVYIPGEIRDSGYARVQLEQIDIARRMIAKYPDVLTPAYTAADADAGLRRGTCPGDRRTRLV